MGRQGKLGKGKVGRGQKLGSGCGFAECLLWNFPPVRLTRKCWVMHPTNGGIFLLYHRILAALYCS